MSIEGGIIAHEAAAAASPKGADRPWWEARAFVAAMILLAYVPFLYPTVPPLVDLPGHMARFRVAIDDGNGEYLRQYFDFHWVLVGNLGVDLIAIPLGKIIGLELATKLIVMSIPSLTVAGFLWVAREVHNRLPPTALFALPFATGHPFLFGFVNFAMAIALAMLAFGLWLRLGRLGRLKLRASLFVPISFVLFVCHTFGWGVLGLLAFSAESVRLHDKGLAWWRSGLNSAVQAAAMAGPLLLLLLWRSDATGGQTGDWFNWQAKILWLLMALRDRWFQLDVFVLAVPFVVAIEALRNPRLALSRNLGFSLAVLIACFVLLPRIIFGSAYADMRLAPYLFAFLMLAIRFRAEPNLKLGRTLAILGLTFVLVVSTARTVSMTIADREWKDRLTALKYVPMGARVVTLAGAGCSQWRLNRSDHIASFVIFRRDGFANDQWAMPGAALLTVHYPQAQPFEIDPSQTVRRVGCYGQAPRDINQALRAIPVQAFDYLWLVDSPPYDERLLKGWTRVWDGRDSVLFKRADAAPPEATRRRALEPGLSSSAPSQRGTQESR